MTAARKAPFPFFSGAGKLGNFLDMFIVQAIPWARILIEIMIVQRNCLIFFPCMILFSAVFAVQDFILEIVQPPSLCPLQSHSSSCLPN